MPPNACPCATPVKTLFCAELGRCEALSADADKNFDSPVFAVHDENTTRSRSTLRTMAQLRQAWEAHLSRSRSSSRRGCDQFRLLLSVLIDDAYCRRDAGERALPVRGRQSARPVQRRSAQPIQPDVSSMQKKWLRPRPTPSGCTVAGVGIEPSSESARLPSLAASICLARSGRRCAPSVDSKAFRIKAGSIWGSTCHRART